MKTRRNRKNRRGGAGEEVKKDGFFSGITDALGLNPDKKSEANGQTMPEAQGQPIQEAVPLDLDAQIKADAQAEPVDLDAQIKADAQAAEAGPVLGVTARTGNANIDDEVAKLTKEEGYYFRAMINAIGVCNSTMKLKYNVLNPLNSEMFICGEECKKRADIIRKTFERFIPYLQESDALGYISTGRVLTNSGTYLGKSGYSLASKGIKGVMNAPSAVGNAALKAPTAIGNAAYTGLTNVGKSAIALSNYFTRKAPTPVGQPVGGRRRRTRRHR